MIDKTSSSYQNAVRLEGLHQQFETNSRKSKKYIFKEFTEQPSFVTAGELHPHQITGVNWLLYNYSKQQNCILADEMGLGKTIQTITFLATLQETSNVSVFSSSLSFFSFFS